MKKNLLLFIGSLLLSTIIYGGGSFHIGFALAMLAIHGVVLLLLSPIILLIVLAVKTLNENAALVYKRVFVAQVVAYSLMHVFFILVRFGNDDSKQKYYPITDVKARKDISNISIDKRTDSIIQHMYDVASPAYVVFKEHMINVAEKQGYTITTDMDNLIFCDQMSTRPIDTVYMGKHYSNLVIFIYNWRGNDMKLQAELLCDESENCVLIKEGTIDAK